MPPPEPVSVPELLAKAASLHDEEIRHLCKVIDQLLRQISAQQAKIAGLEAKVTGAQIVGFEAKIVGLKEIAAPVSMPRRRRRMKHPILTDQEMMALALVAQGFPDKMIADRLQVDERTVRNHVHHILQKLDVESRVQAALYAWRTGIVDPDQAWEMVKSIQWRKVRNTVTFVPDEQPQLLELRRR